MTTGRAIGSILGLLAASLPAGGVAQVLEIGEQGQVTVYDGPSVFNATGATPIRRGGRANIRTQTVVASLPVALEEAAMNARLSPSLVAAVAWTESRFRPGVVSPAGAIGEMQLMPSTARSLGYNPHDSRQNYLGGALYLSGLLRRYDNDLIRALAAYNAGPQAVDRWGGVPPYKETRNYIDAIMRRLNQTGGSVVRAEAKR